LLKTFVKKGIVKKMKILDLSSQIDFSIPLNYSKKYLFTMKKKYYLLVLSLIVTCLTFGQFEAAQVTAYFTNDSEQVDFDSTTVLNRLEVKIDNLDSLTLHGCMIEILDPENDYILQRKIGNKYTPETMDFVVFENDSYVLDIGYFSNTEVKLLIRLEDYKKAYSDVISITVPPYEE
jgi:hypothetical protein